MEKQKKVLIPGGRLSDWALVNAAHKLGLYVITAGYRPDDPAHKFSDKYIQADYSDKEAMLKIAIEEKIDYMVSNSNDFGLISTAYVCEKLGLPGHDSYETTLKLHSKNEFKKVAKKLGIHSPISEIFDNRDEAINYVKNSNKKLIIKPSDNVGSNGVSVPKSIDEISGKVDEAFAKTKNGKIIIEPFIEGFFVPVTSFIINQKVVAFFTEAYFNYPEGIREANEFPISDHSTGFQIPSPYAEEFSPSIIEDFNKIAEYYNLKDGKFHCELLITPEHEAYIFDVHRRMSGFFDPWSHWDISGEINWEEWIVKAECGMDLSSFPVGIKQNKYIHCRNIYAPKNGIIKTIKFDEYLTSHIFPRYEGKNFEIHNLYSIDYLHQPVIIGYPSGGNSPMQFIFDNKEEAERISNPNNNDFYSHIEFTYSNQY